MMHLLCVILALGAPGEVVTIRATATIEGRVLATTEKRCVIVSPLYSDKDRPVYVPARERVVRLKDGRTIVVVDHTTDGRLVWAQVPIGQSLDWFAGIQLADGNLWIDGYIVKPWRESYGAWPGP